MIEKIKAAKEYINSITQTIPKIGVILGTGLGSLADEIQEDAIINYDSIPYFPKTTVPGHDGNLIIGTLSGKNVIAMQGRFHYYEGCSMQQVALPVRVMRALGAEILIATNAAGGLRVDLSPGTLMVIDDHINLMGDNPLIGRNLDEFGVRFPDMSEAYDKDLSDLADVAALNVGIKIKHGVYAGISGPSFSTKAELRMLIKIGADALGMSTVPEVIAAKHARMKVLGISCITDSANPDIMHPPSHEEIVTVAQKTKPGFLMLVKEVISIL